MKIRIMPTLLAFMLTVAATAAAPLTLAEAQRLAAESSPAISEALAKWNAAEHRAVQAGLRPNPKLIVGTEGTPLSGSVAKGDYVLGFSQNIRLGRTAELTRQIAEAEREKVALQFMAARTKVRQRVHGAFGTALYAQTSEQLFAERIRILETNAALTKLLVAAGESVPESEELAHAALDHERLDHGGAQALSRMALAGLAAAIGKPDLAIGAVAGELAPDLGLNDLGKAAVELDRLPELLVSASEAGIHQLRAELARASRIPLLNLGLLYRRQQGSRANAVDIKANITIPLFDNKKAQAKASEADAAAARARTRALRQEAARQLTHLLANLQIAVQRAVHIRDEILPHQDRIVQRRRILFESGESSRLDYGKARLVITTERRHYLDTLREAHRLWAEFQRFDFAGR